MDADVNALQSAISSALVSTTRSASQLAAEDLPFHRALDDSLASSLDHQNARLLHLATSLLGSATSGSESVRRPPKLTDIEDVENNWRSVVDVVDSLLERADTALDEFTGAVRRLSPGADAQAVGSPKPPRTSKIAAQLKAQVMEKPQLQFENVPTNRESGPFKPLLLSKPHAAVPLVTEPVAIDESAQLLFPHPYQFEIEQYRYPSSVYAQTEPIPYHPFDSTTATFVDTEEALDEMLQELKQAKEIAIDLEHHDQRSYIGIVCLMQISTRNRDWIVDTLKPWRRKLQVLNDVFANPSIVKVLHGAYMDIVWLQRDLGLYIVGLFDTHYASRSLGYPGGSLAYLLKRFANVVAQKQYQTADWRVRPLPQELFDYARSDTHYLLYIFDCMRNELLQRSDFSKPEHEGDKVWDVLQKSSETALQRYEHPVYDAELGQGSMGWYKMLSKTPAMLTKEQFSILRAVHKWRDDVAREQDDSVHFVLPNHQIFSIAREIPTTRAQLLGLTQPTTQTTRLRADELVGVILKAKEEAQNGPEMIDVINRIEPHSKFGPVKAAQPGHSVAAFVPKPTTVFSNEVLPLRTTKSTFWGHAFNSSVLAQNRQLSTVGNGISLSVPLPPLTAEVFADPRLASESTPLKAPEPEPAPEPISDREQDDDVFVLKELRRKRKRHSAAGADMDSMAAQSDEVTISHEDDERIKAEAERKRAKKLAKQAAKRAAAEANGTSASREEEEEEPFDYASAPSMLNPPREDGRDRRNSRKKKGVNPYAGMLDTPKGLPRVQRERAGRSATFR